MRNATFTFHEARSLFGSLTEPSIGQRLSLQITVRTNLPS